MNSKKKKKHLTDVDFPADKGKEGGGVQPPNVFFP